MSKMKFVVTWRVDAGTGYVDEVSAIQEGTPVWTVQTILVQARSEKRAILRVQRRFGGGTGWTARLYDGPAKVTVLAKYLTVK